MIFTRELLRKPVALLMVMVSWLALFLLQGCNAEGSKSYLRRNTTLEEVFNFGDTSETKSQPVSPWTDNFEQAMSEAKSTGKFVIADFTGSDWCRWCVRLEKEVFETLEFREWSVDNAILLKIDFPRNTPQSARTKVQNKRLAQKYASKIKGYPTILVLDPEGNVVARTGYVKGGPTAWLAELESQLMQSTDDVPPSENGS